MKPALFHEDFGFRARLELGYDQVRAEWDALPLTELREWPQEGAYSGQWGVFGFYMAGRRLSRNCEVCPETARLLDAIPGLFSAGYSVLGPKTFLPPHRGERADMLRCHLGIVVPDHCALRLGGADHRWGEGRTIVFDDTVEHEAWNRSDDLKVLLLIDFQRPDHLLDGIEPQVGQDQRDTSLYEGLFPDWR